MGQDKQGAKRLEGLEAKTDARIRQVFEAIRQLMTPIEMNKRAIGFVREKKQKSAPMR